MKPYYLSLKISLFLATAFLIQALHAETIKYQFMCPQSGTNTMPSISVSPAGDWTWEIVGEQEGAAIYYDFVNAPNLGVQIGSKGNPYTTATFRSNQLNNISKVVVETSTTSKGNSEVSVYVGEKQMGETLALNAQKNSAAKTMAEYEFASESPLSGEIKVCYKRIGSNASSQAIYLNSISITYEDSGTKEEIAAPLFSHQGGNYTAPFNLEITAATGTIRYTTDGTAPGNGITYTAPIPLGYGQTTVRAIATDDGGNFSEETTATYTIMAGDEPAKEYIPASMEEVEKGGPFIIASEADLEQAWVASAFSSNKINSTKSIEEYALISFRKLGDYFSLVLDGMNLGVSKNDNTNLTTKKNHDWNITPGTEEGQFIISNKEIDTDKPRALLFATDSGDLKYYRSSNLTGYSNYVYLFKEKAAAGISVPTTNNNPQTAKVYTIDGKLLYTGRKENKDAQLPPGIYIIGGKKLIIK